MSSNVRGALIAELSTAMRVFMAHAVLYQDAVAKWAGMNSTDLQCAGLLMLEGTMTPSALATRTGLSVGGAITAVIDRLEAAGYVHRSRDTVDRRKVLVTPNAEALQQRVGPVYARVAGLWNDYLATLDDNQIALATEILTNATRINRAVTDQLHTTPSSDPGKPPRPGNRTSHL